MESISWGSVYMKKTIGLLWASAIIAFSAKPIAHWHVVTQRHAVISAFLQRVLDFDSSHVALQDAAFLFATVPWYWCLSLTPRGVLRRLLMISMARLVNFSFSSRNTLPCWPPRNEGDLFLSCLLTDTCHGMQIAAALLEPCAQPILATALLLVANPKKRFLRFRSNVVWLIIACFAN